MEIYLSHMVIFRVVEKLKLNRILGNGYCTGYERFFLGKTVGDIWFSRKVHYASFLDAYTFRSAT